jgi:hypothetical protein
VVLPRVHIRGLHDVADSGFDLVGKTTWGLANPRGILKALNAMSDQGNQQIMFKTSWFYRKHST